MKMEQRYMSETQLSCVNALAAQLTESPFTFSCRILASTDLAHKEETAELLRALMAHDWEAAGRAQPPQGDEEALFMGVLFSTDSARGKNHYWAALRVPATGVPSVMTYGDVEKMPLVPLNLIH